MCVNGHGSSSHYLGAEILSVDTVLPYGIFPSTLSYFTLEIHLYAYIFGHMLLFS